VLDRPWFRLDLRALVEDHGHDKCLCRVRMRAHATGISVPLVAGMALVIILDAAGLVAWPVGTIAAGLLAIGIAVKDIVSTSRVVWHAVDLVAEESSITPLPSEETRTAETPTRAAPAPRDESRHAHAHRHIDRHVDLAASAASAATHGSRERQFSER
jgi:hypothetical protein